MDKRGYPPGHSLETNSAATAATLNSSTFYGRIQRLSLLFTPEEIVDLSHQLQGWPDAELQRLAADCRRQPLSLSASERSSYLSTLSHRSILSSSSTHSYDSAGASTCSAEQATRDFEGRWPNNYSGSPSGTQLHNLSHSLQVANQDSSYTLYTTSNDKPFCFACNECFKNKGSLSRHQKEQCEREKIAACSLCPPPQPAYYTKERLRRHHVTSHGDKCPNGCSKKENKISIPCRDHLDESFQKLPAKKAWGCPYCVSCFQAFEDWNSHCIGHLRKKDQSPKWCFGTMIWSLLQQDCLRDARMRHDAPKRSHWSTLNEKRSTGLREILEHHRLPRVLHARQYWYLQPDDAIVRCVYDFIGTGETFGNQLLFEVQSKPIPCQAAFLTGDGCKDDPSKLDAIPALRNVNDGTKTFSSAHDLTGNTIIAEDSVGKKASSASQTLPGAVGDTETLAKSRAVEPTYPDENNNSQPRRRGASLKRSLSNLALRPSSSKSSAAPIMAVPPVPRLPGETKTPNADKSGTGVHLNNDWPAQSFLEPIPHYRPMSGVIYDWPWSDSTPSQQ